jgi:hypothetical protein
LHRHHRSHLLVNQSLLELLLVLVLQHLLLLLTQQVVLMRQGPSCSSG